SPGAARAASPALLRHRRPVAPARIDSSNKQGVHAMDRFALVNWLSVFIASLSGFVIGGLWYGPVFGKAWSRVSGIDKAAGSRLAAPLVFGGAWLLNLIAAAGIALQNGAHTGWLFGLHVGLMGAVFF